MAVFAVGVLVQVVAVKIARGLVPTVALWRRSACWRLPGISGADSPRAAQVRRHQHAHGLGLRPKRRDRQRGRTGPSSGVALTGSPWTSLLSASPWRGSSDARP